MYVFFLFFFVDKVFMSFLLSLEAPSQYSINIYVCMYVGWRHTLSKYPMHVCGLETYTIQIPHACMWVGDYL